MKTHSIAASGTLLFALALTGTSIAAPLPKVGICHLEGNGSYHRINVSENALPAHLAHGDSLPGDAVPGSGIIFGETTTPTTFGTVDLDFNWVGATFAADCSAAPGSGSAQWERGNAWSGPIVAVSYQGDGVEANFTVRVTSAPVGPDLVGCDISFRVVEGGAGVAEWEVDDVAHTGPGNTCIAVGQTQGPWIISGGSITVVDPAP